MQTQCTFCRDSEGERHSGKTELRKWPQGGGAGDLGLGKRGFDKAPGEWRGATGRERDTELACDRIARPSHPDKAFRLET